MVDERILQFIWQYRCYNANNLFTEQGDIIQVIHPGRYNKDGGPDFLEAIIQIGDTRWAGHVEIHTKESLWHVHGHERDTKYHNVILHVVWECDLGERRLPTLCLEGRVPLSLLSLYKNQMEQKQLLPCQSEYHDIPEIIYTHWRERLMIERLEQKAADILSLLSTLNNDWNQAAFVLLATYLGLPCNTESMHDLAMAIDYRIMLKNGSSLFTTESILFGAAGLLQDVAVQDYAIALKKEYIYQQHKYSLRALNPHRWQWLRMRPASFPTLRIAQLASICATLFPVMDKIIDNPLSFLLALESIETSSYWESHYTFEKPSIKRRKHIGKDLSHRIGSNVVAPILMAYGIHSCNMKFQEAAIDLLASLPAESNAILQKLPNSFPPSTSSAHTQGLLQLYKQYCTKKRCLDCAIGCHILRRTFNVENLSKKGTFEIREEEYQYVRA